MKKLFLCFVLSLTMIGMSVWSADTNDQYGYYDDGFGPMAPAKTDKV